MKTVRYTQTNEQEAAEADCLIIDCFGLLSSAYHYGDVAYVGGGFGVGIHNVLEEPCGICPSSSVPTTSASVRRRA